MPLTNTTNKVTRAGNGSATTFSFSPMVIYASTDLEVKSVVDATGVETVLSEGTGASAYAVEVSEYPGTGSVRYPEDEVTPIASGISVVIKRVLPIDQQVALSNQGTYFPEVLQRVADKLAIICLQQQEEIDRSLKFAVSVDLTSFDEEVAAPGASEVLAVNSGATGLEWITNPAVAAAASATAAATSETNAATSETNAATSESNAATSESNAAASEAAAQAAAFGYAAVTTLTASSNDVETSDARTYHKVNASSNTVAINLPAIGADEGMFFVIEVVNVDNAITVVRDGTDRINDVDGDYTGLDTVGKVVMFTADDNTPDNWVTTVISQVPSASTTEAGKVELAIASEVTTGTDATRAVTPDALAGSAYGTAVIPVLVFDDSLNCETGDGAGDLFFRIPSVLNGFDLVAVAACCQTAGTTGTMDIQIHNVTQAADMLSTKITIDSTETDSSTAATPAVIDTSNDDVATGDQLRIDVDAVHTTPAKGLLVELQFRLP